ncbi:MAG: PKD domain-containing protein [Lysobacterales bacterium]
MKQLTSRTRANMSPLFALLMMIAVLMTWTSESWAYEDYSSGCDGCHGGFLRSPYISLSDGSNWGDDLHDVHRRTMLNSDCNTCHVSSGRSPAYLGISAGGSGLAPIACVGCHGREEDMGHDGLSPGRGAGLRQHHTNAGETDCMGCHDDADPATYTPVGEDVLPEYYANPGSNHPLIPVDPCNPNGSEGAFAGSLLGLDNDGDGTYDTADSDCSIANVPPTANAGGPYTGTVGTAVSFDGSASSDSDGSISSYAWDFGDGSSGSGVSPSHSYTGDGSFTVSLTVTDNAGSTSTDTTTATISIIVPPSTVIIDEAKWESGDHRLVVKGVRGDRGATVIISNADTGETIGTTRVPKGGEWKFEKEIDRSPCRVRATIGKQFAEKAVKDAPANCGDDNSPPPSSVHIDKAEWESSHEDDSRLLVKGTSGERRKQKVIITNANTGERIGWTRTRRKGNWRFERELGETEFGRAPCRIRATIGNQFDEMDVGNAPANCSR